MNAGKILSKNIEKVLDLIEYGFDILQPSNQLKSRIYLEFGDLQRAEIKVEDFKTSLHTVVEQFPQIEIINLFNNADGSWEIDMFQHGILASSIELVVPSQFRELLKKIRRHYSIESEHKTSLAGLDVTFDPKTSVLAIGDFNVQLPPTKNEDQLCRVLFMHDKGVAVSWDEIATQTTGVIFDELKPEKHRRPVKDTMYALNRRVKEHLNTDDSLFSWEEKTIRRNF